MTVLETLQRLMETSAKPSNLAVDYFLKSLKKGQVKEYRKFGTVKAIVAKKEQKVDTIIDGKLETTNIAKPGDYIVTGPKGEKYVLSADKIKTRYKHVEGDTYKAIGNCYAVEYKGKSFKFNAPWDELMTCHDGDFIASTKQDGTDVYRIEKEVFQQTYKRK